MNHEKQQDTSTAKRGIDALEETLDPEVEAILQSKDPLPLLKAHLDNMIAGEDNSKLTIFLLLLSGKSQDPTLKEMILLKAESGAGKTTLMKVASLFKAKEIGRLSKTALDYMEHGDEGILVFQELGLMDDEESGISTIKFLSGDDQGYSIEITRGDPKEGFTTEQRRIPPRTVISGTTRLTIDAQYERRNWIIGLDESQEQTVKIREFKAKQEDDKINIQLGLISETPYGRSRRILKQVVEEVEPVNVGILFPESLMRILSDKRLRVRGDYDKVLHAAKYYGMLRQRTLPKIEAGDKEMVLLTPEAAVQVLNVIREPLSLMAMDLDSRTMKMIGLFKELGFDDETLIGNYFKKELAQLSGLSPSTIHTYLNHLEKKGYLQDSWLDRHKCWQLIKSIETIEREAAGVTTMIDTPSLFIPMMRAEAMKRLNKLPRDVVEPILHHFTPIGGGECNIPIEDEKPSIVAKEPKDPTLSQSVGSMSTEAQKGDE